VYWKWLSWFVGWNRGKDWKPFPCQMMRSVVEGLPFLFNILKNVIEELAASQFPSDMQLDETTYIS
jgi:hypothetical protein